ncbi:MULTISPECIES: hypothetical protein [unclassified Pseudomonas]|uniref:hypothetical protein n=1 Tax=unclassified Pseudomonas TaxID=196821 RepID=UPI00130076EC|nr:MULTISPECIES: hypothetical protein [unclassified Pseudomonas]NWB52255.1 hypothetical protein [Pseudomonas sp. F8002]
MGLFLSGCIFANLWSLGSWNLNLLYSWLNNSAGLASWAQAFGAVAAILGAAHLGTQQIRNSQQAIEREKALRSGALLAVYASASKNSRHLSELLESFPALNILSLRWKTHIKGMFESNLHIIEDISYQDLVRYEFVVSHTVIYSYMRAIKNIVCELVELCESGEDLASHKPVSEEVKIKSSIAHMYGQISEHNKLVQEAWRIYKDTYEEYVRDLGVDSELEKIERYR